MNILDEIIAHKKKEVGLRRSQIGVAQLQKHPLFARTVHSLCASVMDKNKTGIIAEFKRQSPSKGIINATADVVTVTSQYTALGASGLSVLTDRHFFGGSPGDLMEARFNEIPILRKDFIIDEYQVTEARAMGADAVLLIAACLSPERVRELAGFAKDLGLEVLLELHEETELGHICDAVNLVGINNRSLKTFEVDIEKSILLSEQLPKAMVRIAESGINSVENIATFKARGYHGFLIGENFMKDPQPHLAFARFVGQLKNIPACG